MIISNVKTEIFASQDDLLSAIKKEAGFMPFDYKILRKSLDARHGKFSYVYTIEVLKNKNEEFVNYTPVINKVNIPRKPVIVGAGPSGLFCAYVLSKAGANPVVLERGKSVDERRDDVELFLKTGKLNINSNIQFGEGGAGTFSDGKLMSGIKDPLMRYMSDIFIHCGANKEISYLSKPHLGTDCLIEIIKNLRCEIENNGGKVIFNSKVTDIIVENNRIKGVVADKTYETNDLILAIGHSARDTFDMLLDYGVNMEQKPFSIGFRIEHLQQNINRALYGSDEYAKYLGAADYKLSYHTKENRGVYSFCMCPGGYVIASSSDENTVVTNGMSYSDRNGKNANSAILVGINPEDFSGDSVLSGFDFQKNIEEKSFYMAGGNYKAPVQLLGDYLDNKVSKKFGEVLPTYQPGTKFCNINDLFPDYVNNSIKEAIPFFNKKINGFSDYNAVITAPETRSSSPVRIIRNEDYNSNINGMYPIGEGAGYAGGITSSAVDGIKCALKIIEKYNK